jgi:hypothetical protein
MAKKNNTSNTSNTSTVNVETPSVVQAASEPTVEATLPETTEEASESKPRKSRVAQTVRERLQELVDECQALRRKAYALPTEGLFVRLEKAEEHILVALANLEEGQCFVAKVTQKVEITDEHIGLRVSAGGNVGTLTAIEKSRRGYAGKIDFGGMSFSFPISQITLA